MSSKIEDLLGIHGSSAILQPRWHSSVRSISTSPRGPPEAVTTLTHTLGLASDPAAAQLIFSLYSSTERGMS